MLITSCTWTLRDNKKSEFLDQGFWTPERGLVDRTEIAPTIPMALRRRLTPLGKMAIEELYKSYFSFEEEQHEIPWVTSCRHGDSPRMMNLLNSLAKGEQLSPMDFSLSVHNAIIGLFSIATKNNCPHTALSGGNLSFEMGLLEAYALLKTTQQSVGYIYYDLPLPSFYDNEGQNESHECCLSLILSPGNSVVKNNINLSYIPKKDSRVTENNLRTFIEFLKGDERKMILSIPGGTFLFEKYE